MPASAWKKGGGGKKAFSQKNVRGVSEKVHVPKKGKVVDQSPSQRSAASRRENYSPVHQPGRQGKKCVDRRGGISRSDRSGRKGDVPAAAVQRSNSVLQQEKDMYVLVREAE